MISLRLPLARRFLGSRSFSGFPYKVGFLGLGNMGSGMALNLLKAGHELVLFDKFPACPGLKEVESASGGKARIASELSEVVRECDRIVSMVPATKHVQELYGAERTGVFDLILEEDQGNVERTKRRLLMDSSTIEPSASREVILLGRSKGIRMVDSPVSGAVPAARAGTLTFMVGSDFELDFKEAEEVLKSMGKAVVHTGGPGTGEAAKVCNNLILGSSMLAVAEGYRLAGRLGLAPEVFHQIVGTSSGRCWSSELYNPVPGLVENVPAGREYKQGFMVDLIEKDLSLAEEAAKSVGTEVPMSSFSRAQYKEVSEKGHGNLDFGCVYKYHVEK